MTTATRRGLLVAIVQITLVASLGGKLLADRALYPRVWVEASPVDPMLPIRGRYVSLRVSVAVGPDLTLPLPGPVAINGRTVMPSQPRPVRLAVENSRLVAHASQNTGGPRLRGVLRDGQIVGELQDPLAFFIPDGVPDPSRRSADESLWVEVTVPPKGPPRPIQLGVRKGGVLTPLSLR
jgi:hypothetical protein